MAIDEWHGFLKQWSEDWLSTGQHFSAKVRRERWLGSAPATEEQITALEKKLGAVLPPSYKAFLRITNGWRQTTPFIKAIRPARRVNWLATAEPELIDAWSSPDPSEIPRLPDEEYFSYTDEAIGHFRDEQLAQMLLAADSAEGDSAIYLLNPTAVTEDGEWEAWFFANWVPGAERYPSFAHLMLAQYRSFRHLELDDESQPEVRGPYSGPAAPDRPRREADALPGGRRMTPPPTLGQLIRQLSNSSSRQRKDAAKQLGRKFAPHHPKQAKTEFVEPLMAVLCGPYEADVRAAAALMLGTHGNARAMRELAETLDASPDIAGSILHALFYLSLYYKVPSVVQPVLRAAEAGRFSADHERSTLVSLLGKLRAPQAIPILRRVLSEDKGNDPSAPYGAARAMAETGAGGVDTLIELLGSPSPETRAAAASGLGKAEDERAVEPLRRLLADPDADVRLKARIALGSIERSIRREKRKRNGGRTTSE